ncbi:MAG TPA: PKD domain-containing protein [Candidatus Polarisedimenticolia bacterium]|nr:PKD domain-containing protein [Candidatus Polarisedimenticolia bacterium]
MKLSIVHRQSVTSIGVLGLLMSSLNYAMPAEDTTSASQRLLVTVDGATGDYAIGQSGAASDVFTATVAAKVGGQWLHARDYPNHLITESAANDDLGMAHEWTVRHSGLAGAPELICTLHSYADKPFGDIQVRVVDNAGRTIHIEAIRPIEARQGKILDLGGPVALDRVLSDSFSEDRPALKIRDLGDGEGVHRGVGSQLLYNRRSKVSFFVGALTSNRFLTVARLHVGGPLNAPQIQAFEVDSTGTTELTKENSLKQSPPEDPMELSIVLAPGAVLDSEKLFFGVSGDYHSQLETYGSLIRVLHHARTWSPSPMGWWSWTAYYFGLNEGTALTNAHWLAQHLKSVGYRFFHIDEGYQYARGEYATPDSALFANGMAALERRIRSEGLIPGVWTAPFQVADRSWVYENHRDWLVRNTKGEPIRIGQVGGKDRLFVLDTTNPGAQEYLRKTYSTLVNEWDIGYIKLDFMEDTAVEGLYYRPNTTALEAQKIGLEIIRQAVGEQVLLDKDGSPMLNPVGIVDTGRISLDTGHTFEATRDAAPGVAARYYMNRNFFVSDPDAFCVSTQIVMDQPWHGGKVPLTLDEAKASIALSAVSGGMYEIGDDLPTLGGEPQRLALVQNQDLIEVIKLGRASKPLDLMSYSTEDSQPSIFWLEEDHRQGMLTMFNWTDQNHSRSIEFSSLGLPASGRYTVSDVFDGKAVATPNPNPVVVPLPPHSARVLKIVNTGVPARPPVIKVDHMPSVGTGAVATFRAQPATPSDAVVTCSWNFGDGVTLEGTEVSHAYTKPGTYQVVVTAAGLGGLSTEEHFSLTVVGSVSTRFAPGEKQRYQPPK